MTLVKDYLVEQKIKEQIGVGETKEDYLEIVEGKREGPEGDSRERTFHSFRSREDVPKYLLQFDTSGKEQQKIDKDKKSKYQGEALEFLNQEKYIWDMVENKKMNVVNSVALPSLSELMYRQSQKKADEKEKQIASAIEQMYGPAVAIDTAMMTKQEVEREELEGDHDGGEDEAPEDHAKSVSDEKKSNESN
jgi:hypothetical protein